MVELNSGNLRPVHFIIAPLGGYANLLIICLYGGIVKIDKRDTTINDPTLRNLKGPWENFEI